MFQNIFIEHSKYRMIAIFAISFLSTWLVFRPLLEIALKRNVQDNPDARKLQKQPVPVLGGAAVFLGIVIGMSFFKTMHTYITLFPIVSAMVIMLYVGLIDDISGVKPWKRLVLEVLVAILMIYGNRFCISNFQGIFGIEHLPKGVAIPLSVVAFVGIVNSINMIDGIDGLSSSFCIWICFVFGLLFFLAHDFSYAALAAASIGALLPFFIHNVFGKKSKMFIGDAGTMVMGTMITAMIFELLRGKFGEFLFKGIGFEFSLVSFCLAAMSIPIFDTLRVMIERIFKGTSPFNPDRRHLHHLFLDLNFSSIAIVAIELLLNAIVVAAFVVAIALGASTTVQFITVVSFSLLMDLGTSVLLRHMYCCDEKKSSRLKVIASRSHFESRRLWIRLQNFVDRKY